MHPGTAGGTGGGYGGTDGGTDGGRDGGGDGGGGVGGGVEGGSDGGHRYMMLHTRRTRGCDPSPAASLKDTPFTAPPAANPAPSDVYNPHPDGPHVSSTMVHDG